MATYKYRSSELDLSVSLPIGIVWWVSLPLGFTSTSLPLSFTTTPLPLGFIATIASLPFSIVRCLRRWVNDGTDCLEKGTHGLCSRLRDLGGVG